jgi:hypothetical protein
MGYEEGFVDPYDGWDQSLSVSRPRTFYSILDDLFVRSAVALEWMIARLGRTRENGEAAPDGSNRFEGSSQAVEPQQEGKVRPADPAPPGTAAPSDRPAGEPVAAGTGGPPLVKPDGRTEAPPPEEDADTESRVAKILREKPRTKSPAIASELGLSD